MNRRDLVTTIADRAGVDRKVADGVMATFVEVVTESVAKGEPVAISGFAKFARVDQPPAWAATPRPVSRSRSRRRRRVRITALKAFKDAVLAPKRAKK